MIKQTIALGIGGLALAALTGCIPGSPTVQQAGPAETPEAVKAAVNIEVERKAVDEDGNACYRVKITNVSERRVETNPFYFTGESRDGAVLDIEMSLLDPLNSSKVKPGRHDTGYVCFAEKVVAMSYDDFENPVVELKVK